MKAYIATTGAVFALLVLAHLWRMFEEGTHLGADPFFIVITLASAGFCAWAWRLLRAAPPG